MVLGYFIYFLYAFYDICPKRVPKTTFGRPKPAQNPFGQLGRPISKKVPNSTTLAIVDNKDAHLAVHSATDVGEHRLRREIGMVKQWIANKEIKKLVWVPGELQAADILTKYLPYPTWIRHTGYMINLPGADYFITLASK